jgi:hypothetical protein
MIEAIGFVERMLLQGTKRTSQLLPLIPRIRLVLLFVLMVAINRIDETIPPSP